MEISFALNFKTTNNEGNLDMINLMLGTVHDPKIQYTNFNIQMDLSDISYNRQFIYTSEPI